MTMQSGAALLSLVRNGVNLELDAREVQAELAFELVEIGGASNFTFLAAEHYAPDALERLARIGQSRVTFRFEVPRALDDQRA